MVRLVYGDKRVGEGNPALGSSMKQAISSVDSASADAQAARHGDTPSSDRALCVDLDGTLVATDTLWESLCMLARSQPWALLLAVVWLLRGGKANMKRRIAERVQLSAELLPYRQEILTYLEEQKRSGRRLVLATAADESIAQGVATHLGLFDDVLASDGQTNVAGATKLAWIRRSLGSAGFDYIGDSWADMPVWEASGRAIMVSPGPRLTQRVRGTCEVDRVFDSGGRWWVGVFRALRAHQWIKNLLLFLPFMLKHDLSELSKIPLNVVAFVAYSLCASGLYVMNDLLDLESDRRHSVKCNRPFASGQLSVRVGVAMVGLLLAGAFGLSLVLLPAGFVALLVAYMVLTTVYSFHLKRKLVVDVLALAGFYTLRILAGGVAVDVAVSEWLLAFSVFFFTSLAFVKRYCELAETIGKSQTSLHGRGYQAGDIGLVETFGCISGYLSVMILCLYVSSATAQNLYGNPQYLWLVPPILMYWISRVWFLAKRGEMSYDPVVFVTKDVASLVLVGVVGVIVLMAAL